MIQITGLTKFYEERIILHDFNLTIESGQVYCLLGKNGVGKSTLINTILDLVKPDGGEITISGLQHNTLDRTAKRKLGVLNEDLPIIEELSGQEFLELVGKIYKMPPQLLKKRIADLGSYFFENENDLKKNISKYSTGMKKKIAFCAAVLHTPPVLIMDEPFSGLDPLAANKMVLFLKKYKNEERTILISSHDLSYVEKVCTHIGVLHETKLVFNSTLQDFTENGVNAIDAALMKILMPDDTVIENIDWI